jgi:hypothetical protein
MKDPVEPHLVAENLVSVEPRGVIIDTNTTLLDVPKEVEWVTQH